MHKQTASHSPPTPPPYIAGLHRLPVFLSIKDSKRLQLVLQGRTVVPPLQRLLLTPMYQRFCFQAAPIGEQQPPVQVRRGGRGVGYAVRVCGTPSTP